MITPVMPRAGRLATFTVLVVAMSLAFGLAGPPAQAVEPAKKCEALKVRLSARYALCRLRAQAKRLKMRRDADLIRCDKKFLANWEKAVRRADGACPAAKSSATVGKEITAYTDTLVAWMGDEAASKDERTCAANRMVLAGRYGKCLLNTAAKVALGRKTLSELRACEDKLGKKWLKLSDRFGPACSPGASTLARVAATTAITPSLASDPRYAWLDVRAYVDSRVAVQPGSVWCAVAGGGVCGDGTVACSEDCDDGNTNDGDGCESNCRHNLCGNHFVTGDEECDDGNTIPGDGCDDQCRLECNPNGVVEGREECDDGNTASDDECVDCRWARCGDGHVCSEASCTDLSSPPLSPWQNELLNLYHHGEVCDDGNIVDGDGCDSNCSPTACGNGVVSAAEACDEGSETAQCDWDCTRPQCGDGHVNPSAGEACDPPESLGGGVGCTDDCQRPWIDPSYANQAIEVAVRPVPMAITQEFSPRLGSAFGTDFVVFTSRELLPAGYFGQATIWYQLLVDGVPGGDPVRVATFGDSQWSDVYADEIVYTAYDSLFTLSGHIVFHRISTGGSATLGQANVVHESRIHSGTVVWRDGLFGATRVKRYDVAWLGDPQRVPQVLAGPIPATYDVEICDRFIVWVETATGFDVRAYDRANGLTLAVTATDLVDERQPACSGSWIVWQARDSSAGGTRIEAYDVDQDDHRVIVDDGSTARFPNIDGDRITYESNGGGDYDVYVHRLSTGATFAVAAAPGDQVLSDLLGDLVAYTDTGSGDIQVAKVTFRPHCGDGNIDPQLGEECDDGQANSDALPDTCRTSCLLPACNDGVADSGEDCDGADLRGATCASLGYAGGTLSCSSQCQYLTSSCAECTATCDCPANQPCHGGVCGGPCFDNSDCCVGVCAGGHCLVG